MAFYSIDIATTTAQTADITVALPGVTAATFGNMTITAHTGDFDCIITGVTNHSFGVFTLGTPAVDTWSDVQRTAGTNINVTSFVAAGCTNHTTQIKSVTSATHTWTDTSGTNGVYYCTISYSIATGGAVWKCYSPTGGNNTGWTFLNEFINVNGGEWNTTANWSYGTVPVSTDDVVITASLNAGQTITMTTTTASAKSVDFSTSGNAFTLSGSVNFVVYGSVTLKSGMTWNYTGQFFPAYNGATGTLTSNSVDISTSNRLRIQNGDLILADELKLGTKPLYITNAGASLTTGGHTITCSEFGDASQTGAITLDLGSSTINCTNVSFSTATLTVTANTATINVTVTTLPNNYFGASSTWGGTINIFCNGDVYLRNLFSVEHLTLDFRGVTDKVLFLLMANITVSDVFSIISNCDATTWAYGKPFIYSSGSQRTITVNGSISISGAIDFRDIKGAGSASWDRSGDYSGDLGGNSDITFRSPQTFYLSGITNAVWQFYANVSSGGATYARYATTSGGVGSLANIPLPQDTLIIDNNTWKVGGTPYTGGTFVFHSGTHACRIDASGLTDAGNFLSFPAQLYGSIDYSGSGVAIYGSPAGGVEVDPRLESERASDLTINIPLAFPSGQNITVQTGGIAGSAAGTVKLASNFTVGGTFTLSHNTLDLNGKTLSCGTFSSSNANVRTLQDSTGGGKIIENGLTGTIHNMSTTTNLTVNNAPDIDIGDSNNTLSGNVTFAGGSKTWGDFKVTKHAGNYDCIVTGTNNFGIITQETPDVTYQYADVQWPAGVTTTCTGYVADGTAIYPIVITSSSAASHTLSDSSGTNTVSYCNISYSTAQGGATWNSHIHDGNVNGGNNTGWIFDAILTLSEADTLTLSDLAVKGIGVLRPDTLTLSDLTVKGIGVPRTDTITLSDLISKGIAFSKADTLTLSDLAVKGIGIYKTDTITLSDLTVKGIGVPRTDTLTLSDLAVKGIGILKADTLTLSDLTVKRIGIYKTDTLTLSDLFTNILIVVTPTTTVVLNLLGTIITYSNVTGTIKILNPLDLKGNIGYL